MEMGLGFSPRRNRSDSAEEQWDSALGIGGSRSDSRELRSQILAKDVLWAQYGTGH